MRGYNYLDKWNALLTPKTISLLTSIHEYKGEQNLFIETNADKLTELLDIARIQSTEASNRIEGIYTGDDRLKKIVMDKTMPRNRDEEEIAGYRDVLNTIHENHEYIPIKPNYILQLHGDLFKYTGSKNGGKYKSVDNVIAEIDGSGKEKIRFKPVQAWETAESMNQLCEAYNNALNKEVNPLLLMPMFILDFLCIHPFNDGNGRMSRLLTLLLLYKSGYHVGKYISIEKIIETSKDSYYDALLQSSFDWHEESNDYIPFVEYYLGIVIAAYRDFSIRVQVLMESKISKPERVREIIKQHIGKITKAEIQEKCPDISGVTIQRALTDLVNQKDIIKIGGGRYTSYVWNEEKKK